MKRYLLDTTPLAALLQGRRLAVHTLAPLLAADELATSMLVYDEVIEFLQGLPDTAHHQAELRRLRLNTVCKW